jgi:hypothetical protein
MNKFKLLTQISLCFLLANLTHAQSTVGQLNTIDRVQVLSEYNVREPMLAEHPNGDLYVTGYANQTKVPRLWKSIDKGKTWSLVDVRKFKDGADGNSDVDLMIDAKGTIYFMVMKFTSVPENTEGFDLSSMIGEHIAMGVSNDNGTSWKWQYLSKNDYDDRPWVKVDSDQRAHAIWNDGKGVHYKTSSDFGKTWIEKNDISSKGGSSHLATGPNGLMAVRVTPESASGHIYQKRVDYIKISNDFGETWKEVSAPGKRNWKPKNNLKFGDMQYWVEPLSFDSKGSLYYLWSEGQVLKLGISKDLGENWTVKDIYSSSNQSFFPFVQITDSKLICTWVSEHINMKESVYKLWHDVAYISLSEEKIEPIFLEPMNLVDELNTKYQDRYLPDYGGEYFPAILLSDGTIGVVTTLNDNKGSNQGFTWRKLEIKE